MPVYARQLQFAGVRLEQVAPPVEYHGTRAGYLIPSHQPDFRCRHQAYMRDATRNMEGNLQHLLLPRPNNGPNNG